jgi:hypothetical protein
MIRVRFGLGSDDSMTLGPAPSILISGSLVCMGPDWWIVAVYRDYAWEVRGRRFSCFEVMGRGLMLNSLGEAVGVRSKQFGSFDKVAMADGTLYVDDRLFAKLMHDTPRWYFLETGTFVRDMIIATEVPS